MSNSPQRNRSRKSKTKKLFKKIFLNTIEKQTQNKYNSKACLECISIFLFHHRSFKRANSH